MRLTSSTTSSTVALLSAAGVASAGYCCYWGPGAGCALAVEDPTFRFTDVNRASGRCCCVAPTVSLCYALCEYNATIAETS